MRSLAVLLLLTSAAVAETTKAVAPALHVSTKIAKIVNGDTQLAVKVAGQLASLAPDLDRCAKLKLQTTATLTFENGTVAIAAPSDAFGACITPPLKKVVVKGAGKVVVVIELAVIEQTIDSILKSSNEDVVRRLKGIKGDPGTNGTGKGTGVGATTDLGTGTAKGSAHGDFVSHGKIDTGAERIRPYGGGKEVTVAIAPPAGDLGGYTVEEIDRVIKSRAGMFRACYQRVLNRQPGIGGKLVFKIRIGEDGTVRAVHTVQDTMKVSSVDDCVRAQVMRLKFPAKGVIAVITYPLIFTGGS